MISYSTNVFKSGLKVILDGDPCTIVENEFVKPGKGQAFNRVKLRNLKTGRILEKTFKSGDSLPAADIVEIDVEYLYNDGSSAHFMCTETYVQYEIPNTLIQETLQWIKAQDSCALTLWNGRALSVEPPNFVTVKVVQTEPAIRGNTVSGATKNATLETGTAVRVPLFISIGDLLKIDTRTAKYVARIKAS